jgi:hypothetical protein
MNHGYPPRGVVPPVGAPNQRLNELLDQVRAEFETEAQRSVDYEGTSEYNVFDSTFMRLPRNRRFLQLRIAAHILSSSFRLERSGPTCLE